MFQYGITPQCNFDIIWLLIRQYVLLWSMWSVEMTQTHAKMTFLVWSCSLVLLLVTQRACLGEPQVQIDQRHVDQIDQRHQRHPGPIWILNPSPSEPPDPSVTQSWNKFTLFIVAYHWDLGWFAMHHYWMIAT